MPHSTMTTAPSTAQARPETAPRPCPRCGVIDRPTLGPGSGPHTASLRCGHCQRFLAWTSTKTPAARQQALEARPATAAQLAYLASLGDQARPPGSMLEASARIDGLQRGEVA
jgi:hypothetical protein